MFDLPKIEFEIIEHVVEKKKCPNCGSMCSSAFPDDVSAPTQYGPGIEALTTYLPEYTGVLVHDCYSSYFNDEYQVKHALCGAHLLRECQSIIDHDKHKWARSMVSLLNIICRLSAKDKAVKEDTFERISRLYDRTIKLGYKETPYNPGCGKRGKPKQTKAYNLINRLDQRKDAVLLCLKELSVPFTNNRAEQDIRMVKVKQKVSGSFRTEQGAKTFYRIRGVISTLRKQGRKILDSLGEATKGKLLPFIDQT